MKHLIILGAGNIGKIVCEYAKLTKSYLSEWDIAGFLEFSTKQFVLNENYPDLLGSVECYIPRVDDVFICSYAAVNERAAAVSAIEKRSGRFVNIIHPSANICSTSIIGTDNFIGAFTTLSINTKIGNHIIIQDHCNIGHDSTIGDFSHLYVGNIVCGINNIGRSVTVYTGSTLYPKIRVEDESVIGAGSVVMRNVKHGSVVVGNPAKIIG